MNKTIIITALIVVQLLSLASALTIQSVDVNPKEIKPGEALSLSVRLENNEGEDISNVITSLNLAGLPLRTKDGSEKAFDEIEDDDEKTASFNLEAFPNAQTGIYSIPITITYFNEDKVKFTRTSEVAVTIKAPPVVSFSIEDSISLKGRVNEISMRIINKGLSDLRFLEIRLLESSGYKIISQSQIYIGDLDSDDFENAEFKIYLNANANNNIEFPVIINYKDTLNNAYSRQESVLLRVYSEEEAKSLGLIAGSNTGIIITAVIAVIVLYIIYRFIRKKRKK